MKHTISLKVRNHAGVLSHVAGLFARRGYNIDSIAVGVTANPEISSMTIVLSGDDTVVKQVVMQVRKLTDVIEVNDLQYSESITRELALVTINSSKSNRQEIMGICDVFNCRIVDMTEDKVIVEISGNSRQIRAFIKLAENFGVADIARTGQIALAYQSESGVN